MLAPARFAACVLGTVIVGALLGCAAHGARYSEVVAQRMPVESGKTRIVMLRPNGRYDDYSLSKAVIAVNDKRVGGLAYGGFLVLDVDAGGTTLKASARNPMFGVCELRLTTLAGSTVYFDVAPRTAHVVAGLAGSVAGAAVAGGGSASEGTKEILVDGSTLRTALGSTAGGALASSAESIGKECGGPFRLSPLPASTALAQLEHLSLSK